MWFICADMPKIHPQIQLTIEQEAALKQIVSKHTAPHRQVRRAQIILYRNAGISQEETARSLGINRPVVGKWEKRFREGGIDGLEERKRSGRPSEISPEIVNEIITKATCPPPGRTQWSSRSMAKAVGVSAFTVQKIWRANDIQPHITPIEVNGNIESEYFEKTAELGALTVK